MHPASVLLFDYKQLVETQFISVYETVGHRLPG